MSEGMARIYRDKIFPIHGLPHKFVHDRGPQYHSRFMKELYRLLGIEVFINYHQNDWHEWLPMAEFVYNDREHSATKATPFFADNGRHPYKGTSPQVQSTNDTAQKFADSMRKVWEEVSAALEKAAWT